MGKILLLLALLTSTMAYADFTGKWEGNGQYSAPPKPTEPCKLIHMEFYQTASKLYLDGLNFECASLFGFTVPLDADIQGSDLWFRGRKVGSIDEGTIHAIWAENNMTTSFSLSKNADGSLLFSRSETDNAKGKTAVLSSATLNKIP